MSGPNWIQGAVAKMKEKGTVGSFSAKAAKAGMSVGQYTKKVLADNSKASTETKRQANFARNVNK